MIVKRVREVGPDYGEDITEDRDNFVNTDRVESTNTKFNKR